MSGHQNSAAGPFEDERQVRELPAVQAVYDAFDRDPGPGRMTLHSHCILTDALSAAGIELGAYDHRILQWLAGWEPATCAVVAGWVQRAAHPGPARPAAIGRDDLPLILAALEDAAAARRERADGNCYDCATASTGRCDDHRADLQTASAYSAFRARLEGA